MYDRGQIMTEEERLQVLNWVCANFYSSYPHRPDFTFTEIPLYETDDKLPPILWTIRNRILEIEGLKEYSESYSEKFFLKYHSDLIGVTRDKISIIHPGKTWSKIYPHIDVNQPDRIHTRFNVFVQVPTSGETYYAGDRVEVKQGGYVICRSGMDRHWTDPMEGQPRITISFGFQLPLDKLDEIYKIPADKEKWNWFKFRMRAFRECSRLFGFT